ncbi:hypothetical protein MLD38_021610 [Melastoma candidum]|uniref:Uncharacterized protein n=1 Tax=Melastoma candidum TaxID=119954 RepID=A0ACB9QKH8_9MYRT|nr:hypothetical protein MLD38_021610 [Melastoma candidum]
MLVVDSVFVIKLFMQFGQQVPLDRDDPIFTMSWVFPFFYCDFLCLKNQIRYFILEKIYNEVTSMDDNGLDLPGEATTACNDLPRWHLLDLVQTVFLQRDP